MKKEFFIKIKNRLKAFVEFFLNPHFLICFGIAWMITNGWFYVSAFLGAYFKITWLAVIGTAGLSALWFPFTPEKIITVIIAIALLKKLFPNDEKTLAVLKRLHEKAKKEAKEFKEKFKRR